MRGEAKLLTRLSMVMVMAATADHAVVVPTSLLSLQKNTQQ